MKKTLLLISALIIALIVVLASCGSNSEDTTANASKTNAPATEKTPVSTSNENPAQTDSPITPGTEFKPITTAAPSTTAKLVDELTPNTCDPALTYHTEKLKVKTNNSNKDEVFGTDDLDLGEKFMDTAGNNGGERYADGSGMVVYVFYISELVEPKIVLNVRQDYKISISHDDWEYTEIANFQTWLEEHPEEAPNYPLEEGSYRAGANITNIEIDPYEYECYDTIYVMIEDATPNDGWGGTIMYFEIQWQAEGEASEEGKIDTEKASKIWKEAGKNYDLTEDFYVTGSEEQDAKFIYIEQAAIFGDSRRYCDGQNFIIYYFNMRGLVEPKIKMNIGQNYVLEICMSEEDITNNNWTTVADWSVDKETFEWPEGIVPEYNGNGTLTSGGNFHEVTIDPYDYDYNGNVFIRLRNVGNDGWGGSIEGITITYYVLAN